MAVVEAAAAVVCIKSGSWGVAGGQDPDMLHGTRWVAGILFRSPDAATCGRTGCGTESHEHCGYAGRGLHSLFPVGVTCSRGLARGLAASDESGLFKTWGRAQERQQ